MAQTSAHLSNLDPRRAFAVTVVEILRREGFEALWAGGCVRDQLLGRIPKDYDVASTATPDDVIRIFGFKRTVAVGASFGVVMVLGPTKAAGQIEVATFRSDGEYLDGRRPASVQYCRPEEDAKRRDFTINGLFFDPTANEVIDYVGGRDDLAAGLLRAIGDPVARFREDKLRMLRAVRFAATFQYRLDENTAEAIRHHCGELYQVSVERISQELRRMLAHSTRAYSVELLVETGLLPYVFPELVDEKGSFPSVEVLTSLRGLELDRFEPAMVILLRNYHLNAAGDSRQRLAAVENICRRLKFSNEECECISWLMHSLAVISGVADRPLHILKPLLANSHSPLLLDLASAVARAKNLQPVDAEFCQRYLSQTSREVLSPPALIDGRDVMELSVPAGPAIRDLLSTIRNEQLDELLMTRDQAMIRLRQLVELMRATRDS